MLARHGERLSSTYYSFIDPQRMNGWVGHVGWHTADGLPREMTRQLHVMAQAGKSSPVINRCCNHCATPVERCVCVCAVQCRPMPTSNLRRKPAENRETVASCLCWDRRPPCRRFVCDKSMSDEQEQVEQPCRCETLRETAPQTHECIEAELPPVDCRTVQPPACPY